MKNTRRKTLLVAIALSMLLLAGASTPILAGGDKVTVCHKPGTEAEKTLEIAVSALPAHLAHGDREGQCGAPSAGCVALNTVVPDPQTAPGFYQFAVLNLEFFPGEIIHVDMTITTGQNSNNVVQTVGVGSPTQSVASDGGWVAGGQTSTVSVDYTVVAGDNVSVANSYARAEDWRETFTLDAVHFSCTPN